MNNEEIKELIKLVSKLGLGKVEIEKEGFKINIEGPEGITPMVYSQPMPAIAAPAPMAVSMPESLESTETKPSTPNITPTSIEVGVIFGVLGLVSVLSKDSGIETAIGAGAAIAGIGWEYTIGVMPSGPSMLILNPSFSISTFPSPSFDTNLISSLISSLFMVQI